MFSLVRALVCPRQALELSIVYISGLSHPALGVQATIWTRESLLVSLHPLSYCPPAKTLQAGDSALCSLAFGPCQHTCFLVHSPRCSKVQSPLPGTHHKYLLIKEKRVSVFCHPQLA